MCKKCENYKYFLLWVLSQKKLPKDLQRLIMEKYLECYFTDNDLHENEDFRWHCLYNGWEWHHSIVIAPPGIISCVIDIDKKLKTF